MSVQRLFTSLSARIDAFVGSIENHEAVAEALLSRLADAAARVKLERASNAERVRRLEGSLAAAGNEVDRWTERAVDAHGADPEKALACVERLEQAEARRDQIRERLTQARHCGDELEKNLAAVEGELETARLKTERLKARSACNEARQATESGTLPRELGALMTRWERSVLGGEYRSCAVGAATPESVDELADAFEREERLAERKQRLAELLGGSAKPAPGAQQ
ncbi:MAG: hypothetical protein AAF648_00040 [Pseudomonadota bacterium]